MPFESINGLWSLLALVPFIIMYLRRPKPQSKTIPSLMFLVKQQKISKQYALFRKLVRNMLFFLQLAAILMMAFAIALPFIVLPHSITAENTVIVLDISASMQTKSGGGTRFQKAVGEARKYLSGRISILLAENTPLIILEDGDDKIAADLLGKVKAKATSTNLGDAMILGKDILGNSPGRVVVISDFSYSDGIDVHVAKRILTSNEIEVIFVDVSNDAENVGLVDMVVDKYKTKVYVKNFNDKEETITVKLEGEKVGKSDPIKILPGSVESFEFSTSPGVSEISIDAKDDFELDNKIYVSAPLKDKVKVLLVTDDGSNKLIPALQASGDIELETKYFSPERSLLVNYDVIILSKFQYVPGTFEDLSDYAKKGGKVILSAQDDLGSMRLADLAIINPEEVVQSNVQVCVDVFNQFTKYFQKDKCFSAVSKYVKAAAEVDGLKIATTSDGSPIMALKDIGKGSAFYYGIYDDNSDFWQLPSYPIFWDSLINFLIQAEDISDFNFKSGKIIQVDRQKIKTPSGTTEAASLILDEAGIYGFNSRNVAVNLLDDKESDVDKNEKFEAEKRKFKVTAESRNKHLNLDVFLIALGIIVLIIELILIKRRGDL